MRRFPTAPLLAADASSVAGGPSLRRPIAAAQLSDGLDTTQRSLVLLSVSRFRRPIQVFETLVVRQTGRGVHGQRKAHVGLVIRLLAYTGLRWGELAALSVGSVDTLRRRLKITRAVAEADGRLDWKSPKDHERRSVPFPVF